MVGGDVLGVVSKGSTKSGPVIWKGFTVCTGLEVVVVMAGGGWDPRGLQEALERLFCIYVVVRGWNDGGIPKRLERSC